MQNIHLTTFSRQEGQTTLVYDRSLSNPKHFHTAYWCEEKELKTMLEPNTICIFKLKSIKNQNNEHSNNTCTQRR